MANPVYIHVIERVVWTRIRARAQIVAVGVVERIKRAQVVHQGAFVTAAALTSLACTVFNAKAVVSSSITKRCAIASEWTPKIFIILTCSAESANIVRIDIVLEVAGTKSSTCEF